MVDALRRLNRRVRALDFLVATLAAVGLWAVGLSEAAWLPFAALAVSAKTQRGCLPRLRKATRS